jgi:hypothetical protein
MDNTRFSQDENIKGNGVANEGIVSTRLGLKHTKSCRRITNCKKFISVGIYRRKITLRPFQPKNQYS